MYTTFLNLYLFCVCVNLCTCKLFVFLSHPLVINISANWGKKIYMKNVTIFLVKWVYIIQAFLDLLFTHIYNVNFEISIYHLILHKEGSFSIYIHLFKWFLRTNFFSFRSSLKWYDFHFAINSLSLIRATTKWK